MRTANNHITNVGRALRMCTLLFVGVFATMATVHVIAQPQSQKGKASYYSKRATGARTASGIRLHHDSMTCAHRTYPFGTMLRVTNLTNGLKVVVKVTDRGPYGRGRIIDLSWGAAKAIGMLAQGVVPVVVERLPNTIYPMKPDDEQTELPQFEFEIADIARDITPVWQVMCIDSGKVEKAMKRTAVKSMRVVHETKTTSRTTYVPPQKAAKSE